MAKRNKVLTASIVRGSKLSLGDKEYSLTFPMRSVLLYKQRTGDSLFDLQNWAKIDPKVQPENFVACLWAALQEHHPMEFDQVATLIDFSNAQAVEQAIVECLKSYFPTPAKEEVGGPNAQSPASKSVSSTSGQ